MLIPNKFSPVELFDMFDGTITLDQVAAIHEVSRSSARYHLKNEVERRWALPSTKYPRPERLQDIKIYNEIRHHPKLIKAPRRLAKRTNSPLLWVIQYVARI